jgi:hypothetical protein
MRPLSFAERAMVEPTVSLSSDVERQLQNRRWDATKT